MYETQLNGRPNLSRILQMHPILVLPMLTDIICRYHTRISGVSVMLHTRQFILSELQNVYGIEIEDLGPWSSGSCNLFRLESKKNDTNITTSNPFEVKTSESG